MFRIQTDPSLEALIVDLDRSLLVLYSVSKYSPERIWPRLVPQGSVMVSIYGPDGDQAYGVIANVSEGGAQVVTGVSFESGSRILLRIGFDPSEPFATPADIVWVRNESDDKHKASYVYGVQFRIKDPEQVARLREILENPSFEQPVLPGQKAIPAVGLDGMMHELCDELGKLGERLEKDS